MAGVDKSAIIKPGKKTKNKIAEHGTKGSEKGNIGFLPSNILL
jgi:hypothetical protein